MASGLSYIHFACCTCVCMVSLCVPWLPLTVQRHARGNSNWTVGVSSVYLNGAWPTCSRCNPVFAHSCDWVQQYS